MWRSEKMGCIWSKQHDIPENPVYNYDGIECPSSDDSYNYTRAPSSDPHNYYTCDPAAYISQNDTHQPQYPSTYYSFPQVNGPFPIEYEATQQYIPPYHYSLQYPVYYSE